MIKIAKSGKDWIGLIKIEFCLARQKLLSRRWIWLWLPIQTCPIFVSGKDLIYSW